MAPENVPQHMKAAQISEPVPTIRPHELLVRIHAAGFCHSDLQTLQGQFKSPLGMIPSHEPAGVIVQVGAQALGSWQVGDRARDGRLPARRRLCGIHGRRPGHHGQAARRTVARAGGAADVRGHLGVQFAAARGFRVVAADSRAAGRQLAMEVRDALQPSLVVDSSLPQEAEAQIMQLTDGEGLAAAIVCTDSLPANAWALKMLRIGGFLGVLGLPPQDWRFDSSALVFRELTVRGSYVASKASTQRMIDLAESTGVRSHVTTVSFDKIPDIVDMYQTTSMKGRLVVKVVEG
ncbi:alcohol dehydrogenase 1 [Pyricularia oryzae Y34]|uniref:Alcohol dehydrogenase 1 n=2 Tax=Pyricularia oryzae TaxID=318829 RepID=A0AA97NSF2_PYRO3|nr:alcohol dehydrogenase 1 [Pyricularia oryzae Y34]